MTMHPQFPTWFQALDLTESEDKLSQTWAGLVALISKADSKRISALLRLHMGLKLDEITEHAIRQIFIREDQFFPPSGAPRLLQILAEIALAVIVDENTNHPMASYASQAIVAALHGGRVETDSVTDLRGRAEDSIARLAASRRMDNGVGSDVKWPLPKIDTNELPENPQPDQIRSAVSELSKQVSAKLSAIAAAAQRDISTLRAHTLVKDEELDILWWVTKQQSDTRGKLFASLNLGERGLVAGRELASLTVFEPGAASADALMRRTGVLTETVSVKQAVNACDVGWLETTKDEGADELTPVHLAVAKRVEAQNDNSWMPMWEAITGLNVETVLPENELARLFFVECMVLGHSRGA